MRFEVGFMRVVRVALFALLIGLAAGAPKAFAAPQTTAKPAGLHILADSPPYHFVFDGDHGAFSQRAFGAIPPKRFSVTYLHTDPGPAGYSKHLAWFLARDAHGYALLWCYLDDAGKDFYCWLYQFPQNVLTSQRFTGEYKYAAPTIIADTAEPGFNLIDNPPYSGADFTFPGWSRKAGTLNKLDLYESVTTEQTSPTNVVTPDTAPSGPITRSIQNLTVLPLHQLQVGGANGWRTGGWEELHALAYDSARDPYYLILYTNARRGFVIDLKRARTYTADFGNRIAFNNDPKSFGPKGNPLDHSETPTVTRNTPFEVQLASTKTYESPYTEVILDLELVGPDRRTIRVPGFWDGGKAWKARFCPPKVGNWTWKTFSNDKDLDGKIGVVECTPEADPAVGFIHVHPYKSNSRHFAIGQSTNFYPAYIYDPVQYSPQVAAVAGSHAVVFETAGRQTAANPASFTAFQGRMDALHAAGFNRLTGGFVISGDTAIGEPTNEGGAAFENRDLSKLNPAYFKWMEKRIAYCNTLGIIPDIGIARSPAIAFAANNDLQLRTLWRYLLARFSGYDVCWDLFGPVPADSADALARIMPFAQMAYKFDLFHHPLTTQLIVTEAYVKRFSAAPTSKPTATGGPILSPPSVQEGPPLGLPMWLDVLTVQAEDPKILYSLETVKKPLVVVEDFAKATASGDDARASIWGTRMRSGYFTTDVSTGPVPTLDNPVVRALEICNTFIKSTHFARLEPHMELLNAREESAEQKKRRVLANIQAGVPPETGAPIAANDPKAAPPAAIVLAEPAKEYVLYFQHGGNVTIDLLEATGHIKVTWLNPRTGETREDSSFVGGSYHAFAAPDDKDWVLHLKRY